MTLLRMLFIAMDGAEDAGDASENVERRFGRNVISAECAILPGGSAGILPECKVNPQIR